MHVSGAAGVRTLVRVHLPPRMCKNGSTFQHLAFWLVSHLEVVPAPSGGRIRHPMTLTEGPFLEKLLLDLSHWPKPQKLMIKQARQSSTRLT